MEDLNQVLQLELNLKRLAMVALIGYLYEQKEVKDKIKSIVKDARWDHDFPFYVSKNSVTEIVSNKLKTLNLPQELLLEANHMVIVLGKKQYDWTKYVVTVLQLNISYTDHMYWTSHGSVDDAKIFREFWQNDVNFQRMKKNKMDDGTPLFRMACIYVEEELIRNSLEEMTNELEKYMAPLKLPKTGSRMNNVVAVWLDYAIGGGFNKFYKSQVYNELKIYGKIVFSRIFRICASAGYLKATKYFLNLLSKKDKFKWLMFAAEDCLSKGALSKNGVQEERYAATLHFLISQLTLEQKYYFLLKNIDRVFKIFLNVWPYQELCGKIIDKMWSDLTDSDDHENLLRSLLLQMVNMETSDIFLYRKVYRELLKKLLGRVSKKTKENILVKKKFILTKLFDNFDLEFLSIIINDKDLMSDRDQMIAIGENKLNFFIFNRYLLQVANFMEQVLISNDERKEYLKKLGLINEFLLRDLTAEKVLNWLSNVNDEPNTVSITSTLERKTLCDTYMLSGKYHLIDKVLKWQVEEEQRKYKEGLVTNEFVCNEICKVLVDNKENIQKAEERISNFVKWIRNFKDEKFFESQAFIEVLTKAIIKYFDWNNLKDHDKTLAMIDSIFKFLSLSPEKIKEVKKILPFDVQEWLKTCGISKGDFTLLKRMVDWYYKEDPKEKRKIITDFVNSVDGLFFLNKLRENADKDEKNWPPFLNYLSSWAKDYGVPNRMRKELMPLDVVVLPEFVMGKLSGLINMLDHNFEITKEKVEVGLLFSGTIGYKFNGIAMEMEQ